MNAKQYRAALEELGLTQVGAARLLGINEVTSRRWAKSGVSGAAAILLRLALKKKIKLPDIAKARVG